METPVCRQCKTNRAKKKHRLKADGSMEWNVCNSCARKPYRAGRKVYCEKCFFIPTHPRQLDVDHVDANHSNNAPGNLQTLCANCHRLKTLWDQGLDKDNLWETGEVGARNWIVIRDIVLPQSEGWDRGEKCDR